MTHPDPAIESAARYVREAYERIREREKARVEALRKEKVIPHNKESPRV